MTTSPIHSLLTVTCQGWGVASPIERQVEICVRFIVEGHVALHLGKSGLHQHNRQSLVASRAGLPYILKHLISLVLNNSPATKLEVHRFVASTLSLLGRRLQNTHRADRASRMPA